MSTTENIWSCLSQQKNMTLNWFPLKKRDNIDVVFRV